MAFLRAIRESSSIMSSVAKFSEASTALKTVESGIGGIDSIIHSMPTQLKNMEMVVNEVPMRSVSGEFRVGEINKAFENLKLDKVSIADEIAYKNVIEPTVPDIPVKKMNENIVSASEVHPDLKVTAETGAELESSLSKNSKVKVESMMEKLTVYATAGGLVIGIVAVLTVGGKIWNNIVEATNQRNGCFIVRKVNNKTTSCKILTRSCMNQNGQVCSSQEVANLHLNVYLFLHHTVEKNDTSMLNQLAQAGIEVNSSNLEQILNNTEQVQKCYEFYEKLSVKPPIADPCGLAKLTEGCVACDPTAAFNSPYYVSDENLPNNMTIQCITNSTIIDTLVDVATGVGANIFSAFGDSISGSISTRFWIILAVIIVGLVILGLFFRFGGGGGGGKSKNNDKNNNQPPPQYYQYQMPPDMYNNGFTAPTTINY